MVLIFTLSSIPNPPELPTEVSDKGAHAALYFGLGALLVRSLSRRWSRPVTLGTATVAVIVSAAYGVSDEIHQYFVPPRRMEALDLLADTMGATTAAGALYAWGIMRGRNGL